MAENNPQAAAGAPAVIPLRRAYIDQKPRRSGAEKWIHAHGGNFINVGYIMHIHPVLYESEESDPTFLMIQAITNDGKCHDLCAPVRWSESTYDENCEEEYCRGLIIMINRLEPGQILRTCNNHKDNDQIEGFPAQWCAVVEE